MTARIVVACSLRRQNAAKSCSPTRPAAAALSASRSSGRGQARVSRRRSGGAPHGGVGDPVLVAAAQRGEPGVELGRHRRRAAAPGRPAAAARPAGAPACRRAPPSGRRRRPRGRPGRWRARRRRCGRRRSARSRRRRRTAAPARRSAPRRRCAGRAGPPSRRSRCRRRRRRGAAGPHDVSLPHADGPGTLRSGRAVARRPSAVRQALVVVVLVLVGVVGRRRRRRRRRPRPARPRLVGRRRRAPRPRRPWRPCGRWPWPPCAGVGVGHRPSSSTSSMIAIGAASPLRGPALTMRV